jgi:hypothetical protein
MRLRLLLLAALTLAGLTVPAAGASAAYTVGIAENNPGMFTDPLFQGLGVKQSRVVVSWDVVSRDDDELARVSQYLAAANAFGVEPLVTFEHSRGGPLDCRSRRNRSKAPCKLPSVSAYKKALTAFLTTFGSVHTIAPFNEINHSTQPTWNNPRRAAQYTDTARSVCRTLKRKCTIVVADLLDQADSAVSRTPNYSGTKSYIRSFRRYLKAPRTICGLHNYSDTNRFRTTGTRVLVKALGCKQYWLTETGGIYKFGSSFKASQSRQLKATKYLFQKVARVTARTKRVYVYTYFGGVTSRFDAGLVANGRARSAYAEVKKRVR